MAEGRPNIHAGAQESYGFASSNLELGEANIGCHGVNQIANTNWGCDTDSGVNQYTSNLKNHPLEIGPLINH